MKQKGLIQNFKFWLDGDEADSIVSIQKQTPPRKADDFMMRIAKRIDTVLQDEMFVPLNKKAQAPSKFIVYINKVDDVVWQGSKRIALEETLSETVFERATEIASPNGISVSKIDVEIRLDGSLSHPMFQVTAVWDDQKFEETAVATSQNEYPTLVENNYFNYSDKQPFFTVRYSKNSENLHDIPFYKNQILIGRGSKSKKVDVVLSEPNISRVHANLIWQESGKFLITNLGKNAIYVDDEVIFPDTTSSISPKQTVKVGDYSLTLFENRSFWSKVENQDYYRTTKS